MNKSEWRIISAGPMHALMERNLREWEAELRRRIPLLVADVIDKNRPASAKALGKLGPEGRVVFHGALARALKRDIAAKAKRPRPEPAMVHSEPNRGDEPLLKAKPEWSARRKPRASYVARAWRDGLLRAAVFIFAAMALFHLTSGPTKFFLSIFQVLKDPTWR